MRAVVVREFGGPERLIVEKVEDPAPGSGQVLIEVAVSAITFVDTQSRAGSGPIPAHRPALPYIPGNGVGGTVISVGEGVSPGLIGTQVISSLNGSGGYAELAVADADGLVELSPQPPKLELSPEPPKGETEALQTAVALLADGRTAVGLARAAAMKPGEWVLVEAAGGGVGSLLVQLAVRAGARVIGAASSPAKRRVAEELGAELTVDYTAPGWAEQIPSRLDVVFDGVGGEIGAAAAALLREGGRLSSYGMASGGDMPEPPQGVVKVGWPEVDMRDLVKEALASNLHPTIGQILPLEKAADAHAAMEARTVSGKSLLTTGRSR